MVCSAFEPLFNVFIGLDSAVRLHVYNALLSIVLPFLIAVLFGGRIESALTLLEDSTPQNSVPQAQEEGCLSALVILP